MNATENLIWDVKSEFALALRNDLVTRAANANLMALLVNERFQAVLDELDPDSPLFEGASPETLVYFYRNGIGIIKKNRITWRDE